MKLNVVLTGETEKKQEINIKNPHATVANLRASITIHFKIESRTFTMSYNNTILEDGNVKLTDIPLEDGSTITVVSDVRRRDREEDDNESTTTTTTTATTTAQQPVPSNSAASSKQETEEEKDQKIHRMFELLTDLPDTENFIAQMAQNPEAAIRSLQQTSPELFALVNAYPQDFIEIIQAATAVEAGDDEGGMGMMMGFGGMNPFDMDEGGDFDMEQMLADFGGGDDEDDFDEEGDESGNNGGGITMDNNMFQQFMNAGGGRGGRGGAGAGGNRRGAGRTVGHAPTAATLTADDNEKIQRLIDLGFSREKATEAYLRFGNNVDHAAQWLLDGN